MTQAVTPSLSLFKNSKEFTPYEAGAIIFHAGDAGRSMYAVRSGEVDLVVGDIVVETVATGGIFGEMALIDTAPRSATAIAKTACEVVQVDEKQFSFLVQQTPFFALQVLRVLAARLRNANEGAG